MKKLLVFLIVIGLIFGGIYFLLFRDVESDEASVLYVDQRFVYEGDLQPIESSKVVSGQVYLSYDFIKEKLDEDIHYDEGEKTVIITSPNMVRRYKVDALEGTANDIPINLRAPVTEIDGTLMLPIEAFVYDYPVDTKFNSEENIVTMDRTDTEYAKGKIIVDKSSLREEADIDSPIVKVLTKDTELYVYGETEKFYKVRELNGRAGYVRKRHLELSYQFESFIRPIKSEEVATLEDKEKVNLVWDYTFIKTENGNAVENLVGVNVMSPTWFSLNSDLSITDRSNRDYIAACKRYGYDVWPMFDNNFEERLTENALATSSQRQKIISNMYEIAKSLDVDGINIDFENINIQTRDNFTQFVRELYPIFKQSDMVVSVDVTPRIFSDVEKEPYDRASLAKAADYIMLMAYDQHWATSPTAGSVAEYSWVESNMNVLFRSIPMEKFILSLPLYTRIWFENDGKVTSQSVSMETANEYIKNNNIELEWDDTVKQMVGKKQVGGTNVSIWLEDAQSIAAKTSLATKYDIAGVASWRKGFETPNIWSAINENLN
ncbi:MAG: SH3 domain-containing protein [Tissierellia bacterium]|nr:SH3 domain-containing protein [Tissierellia bacterium]